MCNYRLAVILVSFILLAGCRSIGSTHSTTDKSIPNPMVIQPVLVRITTPSEFWKDGEAINPETGEPRRWWDFTIEVWADLNQNDGTDQKAKGEVSTDVKAEPDVKVTPGGP